LCTTCNLQLRYDEKLNAVYCVDCDYMLVLPPKRNPPRMGRTVLGTRRMQPSRNIVAKRV
jgi:hypothetical protein